MARRRKRFLTVYTVSESMPIADGRATPVLYVKGSFLCRGAAIRECARVAVRRLDADPCMRANMRRSGLWQDLREWFLDGGCRKGAVDEYFDGGDCDTQAKCDVRRRLMEYLVDVIGSDGCCIIGDVRFDVDENDVECSGGLPLWTCITSGRDDEDHDPGFEQAFPEVFLSEDEAVKCAIDDLKSCLEGYSKEEVRAIVNEARERIAENGHFEFDLNDSKTRIWDVWHTPTNIGQGSGKTGRI